MYSINATEMETFDSEIPIYLEDIETGIIQNLQETPEYPFTYNMGEDRAFNVHFSEILSINETDINSGDIIIYAHDNILNVNFTGSESTNNGVNARIMVFNITGRIILETKTTDINNQIPLDGNNSIFVVRVISGNEVANKKVFIK